MADTSAAGQAPAPALQTGSGPVFEGAPFDLKRIRKSVFAALLDSKRRYGGKRLAAVDADGREVTFDDLTKGAFALGHALKAGTEPGEAVGVLLPTGVGAIISFYALSAYGRVPAMLNFTAGEKALRAACHACKAKKIVTARRFIELGELHDLEAALKEDHELIYLEDVRENLSLMDKIAAAVGLVLPFAVRAHPDPDSAAVYLFTSGTEGDPKGVVLSHANLLANVEQVP
jgi:acyl-[acyl-carrier-protein]-phospholipid O-acyltransferase/long-chain-fatty-acid--[acyl-carrier-protein] ligase